MRKDIISDFSIGDKVDYKDGIATVVGIHREDQQYFDEDGEPFWTHEYKLSTTRGDKIAISPQMFLVIKREELKVGDPVIIHMHRNFGQAMSRIFSTVTKITKTQVHVKHLQLRFRKSDGHQVGEAQFAETYFRLEGYQEKEHMLLRGNVTRQKYVQAIRETPLENVPLYKLRILVDTLHPKLLKDGIKDEYTNKEE